MDFNREYDREALKTFFRDEFFPDDYWPGERALHLSPNFKHIREAALLGEVKSWGLPVCEFRHDSSHDPRVSLTRETFRFMAIHSYTDLIALYTAPGSGNYRLSYVRLEFFPNEFNDRKVDVKYSNPRRYSYCLGPEAKVLTPSRILLKKGKVADLDDLRKRFSVEVVNREFYNEIANLFTELVGGERLKGKKTIKHQGSLRLGSIVDHRKMQEFAVRMIGRIVFCWFLRKKAAPGGQPLIPDPVLSLQAVKDNPGYYHAVLERLFFQVLNTPPEARREDLKTGLFVGIPFLNGGLFEPHNDDVYEAAEFSGLSTLINTVVVPDEWLEKFFELLETYNFTIDENTSMDVELSVDPEMLGRIFENLLAEINPETGETARKSTGSYYTPRPVVEYMVDESLKQYLRTRTGLDEEKLDGLLSFSREPDGLLDSEATEKVINALGQLRIIDPACGSGAFPMGVLQKLVLILEKVDPKASKWMEKQLEKVDVSLRKMMRKMLELENPGYIRKMGLIRNAIYGVDIQQIAVEISKLRVFLSLVVDATVADGEADRGIMPLPNLEFKFACADALERLPQLDQTKSSGLFEDRDGINELKKLREEYFESSGEEKSEIKKRFKKIQEQMFKKMLENTDKKDSNKLSQKATKIIKTAALSSWDPFADASAEWFESDWMFGVKDGFDIVISNPPYIRQEKLGEKKVKFKEHYPQVHNRTADIYVYFIVNGLDVLLKEDGVYCIIVANKWMRANYGKKLREFLSKKQLMKLVDFGELPVFENTTTYPCILVAVNSRQVRPFVACTLDTLDLTAIKNNIEMKQMTMNPAQLHNQGWNLAGDSTHTLMDKIKKAGIPLDEYVGNKIYRGVLTGLNDAFVIDEATKNRLISEDLSSAELIKPFLMGKDVKRYKKLISKNYLIFTRQGVELKKYPAIEQYLLKFKDQLMPKPKGFKGANWQGRKPGSYKWYEIQDNVAYYMEFEKPKIIYPNICKKPEFSFDKGQLFTNQKCFIIPCDDKYLLGILNSKLSCYLLRLLPPKLRGGYFEPSYFFMKDFPIFKPDLSSDSARMQREQMEALVLRMLDLNRREEAGDPEEMEDLQARIKQVDEKIDQLVYRLYGLNNDDIAIIEKEIGEKIK